ncbi:NAD-dependent epimerase/dehydratase family protein [Streptomyces sp. OE57]|uniref:NAD-dependent epimerase/dehydratase family protein n=1 Tax=Streptomyces lacaronensis TaxID=3379885 RepID=UPI0039B77351
MHVAVTGGSGTLGTYIIPELVSAGHHVTCVGRNIPRALGVRFVHGDIRAPGGLQGAFAGQNAVVHLAAVPGPNWTTPAELTEVNVSGTVNVLEEAVRAGVDTVVFASTGAATGFAFGDPVPRYLPIDEEHPNEPHDPYGLSKLLGELVCARYTRAYGIRTICLRVHNTWYVDRPGTSRAMGTAGWGRDVTVEGLWGTYLRALLEPEAQKIPGPPSARRTLWGFVDARDVARAFVLAVENETLDHEVFLVTGAETCSTLDTPALIARHFPGMTLKKNLRGHMTLLSHDKAKKLMGYHPVHSWRESDFANWLRRRHPGLASAMRTHSPVLGASHGKKT